IISLVIVIIGATFAWGQNIIKQAVEKGVNPIVENVGGDVEKITNEATAVIGSISSPVGLLVFFFGLVILGISTFGCVGAVCNIKIILQIYAALVGIIILTHAIILIIHFSRPEKTVGPALELLRTMVDEYQSLDSGRPQDFTLSLLMVWYQCCGYDNGEDFLKSKNFTKKDKYGSYQFNNLMYPLFCCKTGVDTILKPDDCPKSFTEKTSNINVGCAKPLAEKVLHTARKVALGSIVPLLFNVALLVLTVLVIIL
ncbi:Tetraspanin-CD63 receptor, partial [Fasciolopsis buskii]